MGVVRDIEIKLTRPNKYFDEKLREAARRFMNPFDEKDLFANSEGTNYQLFFDRDCYDEFIPFLLRCCNLYFEDNDVEIIFDADGDCYDERIIIKSIGGKVTVEFPEKVTICW